MKVVMSAIRVHPFHKYGGAEIYIYNLAKYLLKNGVDVKIIASMPEKEFRQKSKQFVYDSLHYEFLPSTAKNSNFEGDAMQLRKVLLVASSIYPFRFGGIEFHVHYLARHLISEGIYVEIITEDGIVTEIGRKPLRVPFYTNMRHFLAFDVLHVHGFPPRLRLKCVILLLLFKMLRKRKIFTPHGMLDLVALKCEKSLKYKIVRSLLVLFINKFFDKVIAVYPDQQKIFEKIGIKPRKIVFIPNGLPEQCFVNEACEKVKEFKSKYGLANKKVITFIGRLVPHKKVDDLIEAVKEIAKEDPNIFLIIAGPDGGELNRLKRLVKQYRMEDKALFLSPLSDEEKSLLLDSTHIFVNTSSYEAFGISVAEAMAKGIPVISANNPGAKYLLDNGFYGILYEIGDKDALKREIKYLLENPEVAKYYGEKGRERVQEFKWEKIVALIRNVYGL